MLTDAAARAANAVLDSRLVMVTGKGGTGKTTFAAALAVLGATRGKRTLIAEIDAQMPAIEPVFGVRPTFEPQRVRDNLDVCNLTWEGSLKGFLSGIVPSRRIVKGILNNRMVSRFLDFTPGSQEIVTLSALGDHVDDYDLVVVDMPASGHAFSLLDITRSALGLFRSGPVRTRAQELRTLLHTPSTRLVFVALPEEMVVNETLETCQKLQEYELLSQPPVVFLNRSTLPSLTEAERELLQRLSASDLPTRSEEFVRAGRWEDELEQATAHSEARLAETLADVPVLVPPAPPGGVPRTVVESVSVHLGRLVGITRRDLAWS